MKLLVFIWVIGGLCAMAAALYLLRKISRDGASGGETPPGKFSGWYWAPWVGRSGGQLLYGRIGEYVLGDLVIGTSGPVKNEVLATLPCGFRPVKTERVSWSMPDNDETDYYALVFKTDGTVRFESGGRGGVYKCKYHFETVEGERK